MPFTIVVSLLPVTLQKAETKRADVKLVLDGDLAGFELVGFQVWANADAPDTFRVDLPARSWKFKSETRYYTILRDVDPERSHSNALKSAIIAAFLEERRKGKKAQFGPRPKSLTAPAKSGPQAKPTPRLVDNRPRAPRTAADLSAQLAAAAELPPAPKVAAVYAPPGMTEIALAAMDARAADAAQVAHVAAEVEATPALVATADPATAAPRPRRKARPAARRVTRPTRKRPARKAPRRRTAARKGGAR